MWRGPLSAVRALAYSSRRASRASGRPPRPVLRLALVSIGAGTLCGTVYSAYTHYRVNSKSPLPPAETSTYPFLTKSPDIKPHYKVNGRKGENLELVLFQYGTCPFCCKVRAYLDANSISYRLVEVDAVLRQAISWSKYKKVPMLIAKVDGGYQQLYDSTAIISILETYFASNGQEGLNEVVQYYPIRSYTDDSGKQTTDIVNKYFIMHHDGQANVDLTNQNDERKWREWADSRLVHLISPNVYRTLGEAYDTFEWFSVSARWRELFPAWEVSVMINVGAVAMWMIAKRLKARHNLGEDVRTSLYEAADKWCASIGQKKFHGGNSPDLADLSVYGVLSSMEGCSAFKDLTKHTNIGRWYDAITKYVNNQRGHLQQMDNNLQKQQLQLTA